LGGTKNKVSILSFSCEVAAPSLETRCSTLFIIKVSILSHDGKTVLRLFYL